MESKRNEAVDVELAGNGEKGFTGEGDGRIERYEGRVRESARRLMEEVFKNVPKSEELKTEIAAELGIAPRTLSQKLKGTNGFSWDEVKRMQRKFFPDVDKDTLMQRSI